MKKTFSIEWPDTAGQVWIDMDNLIKGLDTFLASGEFCSVPIKVEWVEGIKVPGINKRSEVVKYRQIESDDFSPDGMAGAIW